MQKVQLTYKFRLYPKKEQEEKLLETFELCRQIYNYFLAQWNGKKARAEMKPLLVEIPASLIVEAGSPNPFRGR
jgi:transposase